MYAYFRPGAPTLVGENIEMSASPDTWAAIDADESIPVGAPAPPCDTGGVRQPAPDGAASEE